MKLRMKKDVHWSIEYKKTSFIKGETYSVPKDISREVALLMLSNDYAEESDVDVDVDNDKDVDVDVDLEPEEKKSEEPEVEEAEVEEPEVEKPVISKEDLVVENKSISSVKETKSPKPANRKKPKKKK